MDDLRTQMDLSQSLETQASVCVLVVGLGDISRAKFSEYFKLLSHFKKIKLADLTLGGSAQYRSNDGDINLRFIQRPPEGDDYDDFQVHRRVLGLVGVIDCQRTADLGRAAEDFAAMQKKFPTALDSRCYAFEPTEAHQDNTRNVVLIPNQEKAQVKFYMGTMMNDFASTVLERLTALLQKRSAEKGTVNRLIRISFERVATADEQKTIRRRSNARFDKMIADLTLLAALPQDAHMHYFDAGDQARTLGDWLWLGGCLEGTCAAMVMKAKALGGKENVQEVMDKMNEAVTTYKRVPGAVGLMLEATFKLARYCAKNRNKLQAATLLAGAATYDTQLPDKEKMRLYYGLAVLYMEMSCKRKAAFHARQLTVLMSKGSQATHWAAAHSILLQCLPAYNIGSLDTFLKQLYATPSTQEPTAEELALRQGNLDSGGWPALQQKLLKDLIFASRSLNDPGMTAEYISFLLHTMHGSMGQGEQEAMAALLDTLTNKMPPHSAHLNWPKMPKLVHILPDPGPEHLRPQQTVSAGKKKTPFIYSPFARSMKKDKEPIVWVEGEVAVASIKLSNPMAFALVIEKMALIVTGVDFESYPISFTLPPQSEFDIMLYGKPLSTGTLKLIGLRLVTFGVVSEHSVTPQDIEVMQRLPVLSVSHCQLDTDQDNANLELLEGETLETQLRLENVGSESIDWVQIMCDPIRETDKEKQQPQPVQRTTTTLDPHRKWETGIAEEYAPRRPKDKDRENQKELVAARERLDTNQFLWPNDVIAAAMPLAPGCSVLLPITILGHVGSLGGTFLFKYGSSRAPDVSRTFRLKVPLAVSRVLMFSRFDIQSVHRTEQRTLDVLNIKPTSDTEGEQGGANKGDMCLLAFDVINNSRHCFTLSFGVTPKDGSMQTWRHEPFSIILEGYCVRRVLLPVRRISLPFDPSLNLLNFISPTCNQVRIDWTLGTRKAKGRLWFDSPPLTAPVLQRLAMPRLEVTVTVTDGTNTCTASSRGNPVIRFNARVGQQVDLAVAITDVPPQEKQEDAEGKTVDLTVRLIAYQDADNGSRLFDLDDRVAKMGLWDVTLTDRVPGSTTKHRVCALFHVAGRYKVIYQCTPLISPDDQAQAQAVWSSYPIEINVA